MKPDPKPQLSQAAIKSNIEYYKSICDKYRQGYKDAKQELKKWELRLNEISPCTDKQ
jgi:hypothetical protein